MKSLFKRTLALLLAVMLLSSMAVPAYAEGECEHDYVSEITTAATCTADGVETFTCSKCGDSYTGHIHSAGHSYGEWTTTTEASCTVDGEKSQTCVSCGDVNSETIPAGHSYGEWTTTTEASCTVNGEKTQPCSVCGDVNSETITAPGHNYGEWTTTTEATCTAEGEKSQTCEVCGDVQTGIIEKLDHNYVEHKCSVCGEAEPLMKNAPKAACTGRYDCPAAWEDHKRGTGESDLPCMALCTCTELCKEPNKNCELCRSNDECYKYCQVCTCTALCTAKFSSCNRCSKTYTECEGTCIISGKNGVLPGTCTSPVHVGSCDMFTGEKKYPSFTVTELWGMSIDDYPMQSVLKYKTTETEQEAVLNGFGDYITEFYLSFKGFEGSLDMGGCAVGGIIFGVQRTYAIDAGFLSVKAGESIPMVSSLAAAAGYGSNFALTWKDICFFSDGGNDFTCGISINKDILKKYPDFGIDLSFVLTNPYDASDSITLDIQSYDVRRLMNKPNAVARVDSGDSFSIHNTLSEAASVATNAGDVITLLDTATLTSTDVVSIASGVTLDLKGKKLVGNVLGTVKVNGGTWHTYDGTNEFKMVSSSAETSDYCYISSGATIVSGASSVTLASGTLTLGCDWRTLPDQTITVADGATFIIPGGLSYGVYGNAVVNGTLSLNGDMVLGCDDSAELKAASLDASITTKKAISLDKLQSGIEGYEVAETVENGVYTYTLSEKTIAKIVRDGQDVKSYSSLAEAAEDAQSGDSIVLLEDYELPAALAIDEDVSFDLNGKTLTTSDEAAFSAEGFCSAEDADNEGKFIVAEHSITEHDDEQHWCAHCEEKEDHIEDAPAGCFTKATCAICVDDNGQPLHYGPVGGHDLEFSIDPANKNVIVQICTDPSCPGSTAAATQSVSTYARARATSTAHKATATLRLKSSPVYYTGKALTPAEVVYSDNWVGEKPQNITYNNNIGPGKAKASTTIGAATAELEFEIVLHDYKIELARRYTAKSDKPLVFSTDGPADKDKLESVTLTKNIGGKVTEVSLDYVTLKAESNGTTTLTISKSIASKLERGRYTIEVVWDDGSATDVFRIISTPVTGDESDILLLSGVALASLAAMAGAFIVIKKKSRKET